MPKKNSNKEVAITLMFPQLSSEIRRILDELHTEALVPMTVLCSELEQYASQLDTQAHQSEFFDLDTAKYTAIPPLELYIPNSFTPNGDGINDLYGVKGSNVYSFEMTIMDRWGKEVFHTNDIDQKWNGSNQGNDYQSGSAVYNYLIIYKGQKEEDAIELTGFITVVR